LDFIIENSLGISGEGISNVEKVEFQEIAVMGVQDLDAMVAK